MRKPKTITDPRPSAGIETAYRKKLEKLIDRMNCSIEYWLKQAYKSNEPVMAMDVAAGKFEWIDYRDETIALTVNKGQYTVAVDGKSLRAVNKSVSKFNTRDAAIKAGRAQIDMLIRTNETQTAQRKARKKVLKDGLPARELQKTVRDLARQWQKNFDEGAADLARYFAKSVARRNDKELEDALRKAGFSVQFSMTPAQRDVLRATVNANVSLIKSIPRQHMQKVEGMVMRSVQTGRDLGQLSKDLRNEFGVTRRRAHLIARDQNNKATSALTKVRQDECGIEEAYWRHSHAGKHPRPTHVAADGKKYKIAKGMYLDGKWTYPGFEINCKCFSQSVVPGYN